MYQSYDSVKRSDDIGRILIFDSCSPLTYRPSHDQHSVNANKKLYPMTRLTKLSMFDESSLNDEIDEIEEFPNETNVKHRIKAENTAFRDRTHDPTAPNHHSAA